MPVSLTLKSSDPFVILGAVLGPVTHTWEVWRGLMTKPSILRGASTFAAVVVSARVRLLLVRHPCAGRSSGARRWLVGILKWSGVGIAKGPPGPAIVPNLDRWRARAAPSRWQTCPISGEARVQSTSFSG